MKKIVLIVLILILGVFIWFRNWKDSSIEKSNSLQKDEIIPEQTVGSEIYYSLNEVAEHDNKNDCWMVIDDKVYDVTAYILSKEHPGKKEIIKGCGLDASDIFHSQPHSSKAAELLINFQIGVLYADEISF